MGRHEPAHYMKYEFEKPMRFCGMNVFLDWIACPWFPDAPRLQSSTGYQSKCIFWHSAILGRFVPVVYGICQGLPSDILSIYIMIYFNGQYWLYTWYFILYVKKFGGFFNICCSFMLCNTHVTCYLYRSFCMIYL